MGLHPRALLPAAAREPVARGDRAATERAPVRDWNERITAECYRPNTSARVVDQKSQIISIVDNYQRMSFNVGPTLMSWLEPITRRRPRGARRCRRREPRALRRARLGDGAGLQPHDHAARVAARSRDTGAMGHRRFRHRFGRAPEGMWLPECAVDTASLEVLAAEGIAFTVLAPYQAKAWRAPGGDWRTSRSIRVARTSSACRRAARSICSSTTARPRRPSRSNGYSPTATRSSRG